MMGVERYNRAVGIAVVKAVVSLLSSLYREGKVFLLIISLYLFTLHNLFAQSVGMYPLSKKKPKFEDEWMVEGNALLDSAIHFLGTIDQVPLIFKTNNVERMRISSNGNIGIGTFNPAYPFHVEVPSFIRNQVSEHLHVTHHLSVGPLRISKGIGCVTDTLCTDVARDLWLQGRVMTMEADTVRVFPKVGTLSSRVEIAGSLVSDRLFLPGLAKQGGGLLVVKQDGEIISIPNGVEPKPIVSCYDTTYPASFVWRVAYDSVNGIFDTSRVITSPLDVRIGIGVCDPQARWVVLNYKNLLPHIVRFEDAHGHALFVVDRDGRVGLNVKNPQASLHLSQSGVIQIGRNQMLLRIGLNPIASIDAVGKKLYLNANSGETVEVGGGIMNPADLVVWGQVGIGTNPNPNYALSVCGVIRSKEWVVEANWCDYVFDSTYQRPSWEEVKAYYTQNKRLPKIPSAEVIEKEGLPMSKVVEGMMYNIELNRLDVTALYEEMQALKQEVERLKKENESLRRLLLEKTK